MYKDFEKIYFPYNMDFRGRAYPVPPHLSNVGSDLCRGLLHFAKGKPLGPRGLYWLKVHLANFAGKDKMTFDDRAKFVDNNIENVRLSVKDPFAYTWWMEKLEDPFQGLATCVQIIAAIDSGHPESYVCNLPVHMDGSCNGLQHYAALGRDVIGGRAVNLCDDDMPQDVYIGVMHEVIRRVAEEAARSLEFETDDAKTLTRAQKKAVNFNRAAKLVNGLIDRGVVKRTVMTSVYGVTYIGARSQIQEKIEEKLEEKGFDLDEMDQDIYIASGYLASLTMEVMGDLFTGAKETMTWLTTCARLITQRGHPVAWISPIGLPAIQPYRVTKTVQVVTLMQSVVLNHHSDDLPIHKQRQVSAFPPNFVHSLDSSHMLLTALEMDRRGLTFSAVHDSFWTHACDIDEMNDVLREVFVDLYSQPLLENLKETWESRYPDLTFPDLPKRGELNLDEVKKAKYFFQ
jgi:DNA-directed RNA polymerase